jgi:hypothetical protein
MGIFRNIWEVLLRTETLRDVRKKRNEELTQSYTEKHNLSRFIGREPQRKK